MDPFETKVASWSVTRKKKIVKEARRKQYYKLAKRLVGITVPMLFREGTLLVSHPEGSPIFMMVTVEENTKKFTVTLGSISAEGVKDVIWTYTRNTDEPPKRGTVEPTDLVSAFLVDFPEFVISLENGKPLVLETDGQPSFMGLKYFITLIENGATQFRLAIPS